MSTYVPIQTITLSTTSATVTFTGIPQTYTDLVLVAQAGMNTTTGYAVAARFNGDTSSSYSQTRMYGGSGTNASSDRASNQSAIYFGIPGKNNLDSVAIYNFMNYSNVTTNKTVLEKDGNSSSTVFATVGLWRKTEPITSITLAPEFTASWISGSTFTLYGVQAGTAKAVGGEVHVSGGYAYHTFKQSGLFIPTENLTNVDYLVVAGGGGTISVPTEYYAGGGGGGGLRSTISPTGGGGSPESKLSLSANTLYTVTVGAGGAATANNRYGIKGNDSTFSTIVSEGGGYGSMGPGATSGPGGNGGSGGGAGSNNGSPYNVYSGGTGASGQGYNGGSNEAADAYAAGAGGGAAGAGGNGSGGKGGTGGAAALNSISGTATYYAGGGWGGRGFYGAATRGDSGTGFNTNPNTGMGAVASSPAGQSGIVIVRYAI